MGEWIRFCQDRGLGVCLSQSLCKQGRIPPIESNHQAFQQPAAIQHHATHNTHRGGATRQPCYSLRHAAAATAGAGAWPRGKEEGLARPREAEDGQEQGHHAIAPPSGAAAAREARHWLLLLDPVMWARLAAARRLHCSAVCCLLGLAAALVDRLAWLAARGQLLTGLLQSTIMTPCLPFIACWSFPLRPLDPPCVEKCNGVGVGAIRSDQSRRVVVVGGGQASGEGFDMVLALCVWEPKSQEAAKPGASDHNKGGQGLVGGAGRCLGAPWSRDRAC